MKEPINPFALLQAWDLEPYFKEIFEEHPEKLNLTIDVDSLISDLNARFNTDFEEEHGRAYLKKVYKIIPGQLYLVDRQKILTN